MPGALDGLLIIEDALINGFNIEARKSQEGRFLALLFAYLVLLATPFVIK